MFPFSNHLLWSCIYCMWLWRALLLFSALCGMVSTVWFPIGKLDGLMSFGFSLYAGWVGSALCFIGGSVMICCSRGDGPSENPENRYYYSNHSEVTSSGPAINSHAKSAHVWEIHWEKKNKTQLFTSRFGHTSSHTHTDRHTTKKYVKNLFSTAMDWLHTSEDFEGNTLCRRLEVKGFVRKEMNPKEKTSYFPEHVYLHSIHFTRMSCFVFSDFILTFYT